MVKTTAVKVDNAGFGRGGGVSFAQLLARGPWWEALGGGGYQNATAINSLYIYFHVALWPQLGLWTGDDDQESLGDKE